MGQLTEAAVIKKVSRRNYMIRCCGSESCRGPDYPRKTFVRTTTTTRNPLAVFQYQRPTRGFTTNSTTNNYAKETKENDKSFR
ncbi:hypothetical protein B566_EDAN003608 [Ephemera danica]|nr:hypothetical protein B566_EDAN003608 [Ephemera danica]